MSSKVRALCTKTTSTGWARSYSVRVIDISGVTPLPADRNRYFGAGCWLMVNRPRGPRAHTVPPGVRWSCSQLDTCPPGTRFTVMVARSGRVGAEERV